MQRIKGILPALFTPFDASNTIKTDVLSKMVDWLLKQGVNGLFCGGTTGEGLLLSFEERKLVLETAIEAAAGRGPVVAHVGAPATHHAIELAKHAEKVGAAAISTIAPATYGKSKGGIHAHFRAMADCCGLPLILYHHPGITSVDLTPDLVAPLVENPKVIGMKFSNDRLYDEYLMIRLRSDFDVMHGVDETLLYALMLGAKGGIGMTYNFMPKLYLQLVDAHARGDLAKANGLQHESCRAIEIFARFNGGNPIGLGKVLMESLGFDCGKTRLPNPPIAEETAREFLKEFERAGYLARYT